MGKFPAVSEVEALRLDLLPADAETASENENIFFVLRLFDFHSTRSAQSRLPDGCICLSRWREVGVVQSKASPDRR